MCSVLPLLSSCWRIGQQLVNRDGGAVVGTVSKALAYCEWMPVNCQSLHSRVMKMRFGNKATPHVQPMLFFGQP